MGMGNESERRKNKLCEPRSVVKFSSVLFVPRSDSIPMNLEQKDTHSLYLQCLQQRLFLKFSEKKIGI